MINKEDFVKTVKSIEVGEGERVSLRKRGDNYYVHITNGEEDQSYTSKLCRKVMEVFKGQIYRTSGGMYSSTFRLLTPDQVADHQSVLSVYS